MTASTPKPPTADAMSGYKVTVTRTLHLLGRYRSRESAEEFGRGLADSGQLAPSDWETAVTVEPLDPDPAADRKRRAANAIADIERVGREYPDGVHTCAELQELEPGRRPCTCGRCPASLPAAKED